MKVGIFTAYIHTIVTLCSGYDGVIVLFTEIWRLEKQLPGGGCCCWHLSVMLDNGDYTLVESYLSTAYPVTMKSNLLNHRLYCSYCI